MYLWFCQDNPKTKTIRFENNNQQFTFVVKELIAFEPESVLFSPYLTQYFSYE